MNQPSKNSLSKKPVPPAPAPVVETPEPGSIWQHKSGTHYTVFAVSSKPDEGKEEDFPVTVFYVGPDGRQWPRPLKRWHGSMTLVSPAPYKPNTLMALVHVTLVLWRAVRTARATR
jgi:hypothetical protein